MALAPISMSVNLQEELQKQLNIDEVFGFDVKGVHVGFDESTVVSWIIIVAVTILAIFLTRNLKVQGEISKRQMILEMCYEKAEDEQRPGAHQQASQRLEKERNHGQNERHHPN